MLPHALRTPSGEVCFSSARGCFPAASVSPPVEVVMKYRFSDFEIDLNQHELRREGVSVHIEPQVFDVIVHLVRNHDRVVSKDELIDTVWNGRAISEAA